MDQFVVEYPQLELVLEEQPIYRSLATNLHSLNSESGNEHGLNVGALSLALVECSDGVETSWCSTGGHVK